MDNNRQIISNCKLVGWAMTDEDRYYNLQKKLGLDITEEKVVPIKKESKSKIIEEQKPKKGKKPYKKKVKSLPEKSLKEVLETQIIKMLTNETRDGKTGLIDYFSLEKIVKLSKYLTSVPREVLMFLLEATIRNNSAMVFLTIPDIMKGLGEGNDIFVEGVNRSRTAIINSIEKFKKMDIILKHSFNEADDDFLYLLNIPMCHQILALIETGKLTKSDCEQLNRVLKTRQKRFFELDFTIDILDSNSKKSVQRQYKKSTTDIQKMYSSSTKNVHQKSSKRLSEHDSNCSLPKEEVPIRTKKKKEESLSHKLKEKIAKNVFSSSNFFDKNFSEKENEYINKLINVSIEGKDIGFTKSNAEKIIKLGEVSGQSIFEVIDNQIEYLPFRNNKNNSPWAGILHNNIIENKPAGKEYTERIEKLKQHALNEKYLTLIDIFEPNRIDEKLTKERTERFLKDRIYNLSEIAINNKSFELRNDLLNKIAKLKSSCDLNLEFGWEVDNKDSGFYQLIERLENMQSN